MNEKVDDQRNSRESRAVFHNGVLEEETDLKCVRHSHWAMEVRRGKGRSSFADYEDGAVPPERAV